MQKNGCLHRYVISEDPIFTNEDGVQVMISGGNFQKCNACGHVNFPLKTKKLIEASLKEKRLFPQDSNSIHINVTDLS